MHTVGKWQLCGVFGEVLPLLMNVVCQSLKYLATSRAYILPHMQVNAPDGGDFYVWDGCAACVGGVRIDFSVSGLRNVESDGCEKGVVPGVTWTVTNTQIKKFVAWLCKQAESLHLLFITRRSLLLNIPK